MFVQSVKALIVCSVVLLSGCKFIYSDKPLFDADDAEHPFGQGTYWKLEGHINAYIKRDEHLYEYANDGTDINASAMFSSAILPFLNNYKQYFIQVQYSESSDPDKSGLKQYQYLVMLVDDAGIVRFMDRSEDLPDDLSNDDKVSSFVQLWGRFVSFGRAQMKLHNRISITEGSTVTPLTEAEFLAEKRARLQEKNEREAARIAEREAAEARQRRAAEDERTRIAEAAIEAARQAAALQDREPTVFEMREAMRNTIAGAIFPVDHVQKIGKCRKVSDHDYYCRYQYSIGYNWGNFWKIDDTWHFQRVQD